MTVWKIFAAAGAVAAVLVLASPASASACTGSVTYQQTPGPAANSSSICDRTSAEIASIVADALAVATAAGVAVGRVASPLQSLSRPNSKAPGSFFDNMRKATKTYTGLGDKPPRLNLSENDDAYSGRGAHTIERHGPDVPLKQTDAPGARTIEGRIYGDQPWGGKEAWSYRWKDYSTMNRTVNDYIQTNWDTIRTDLALETEHQAFFVADYLTGEGFYNDGMYGAGARSASYGQTSGVRLTVKLIPGDPPSFFVGTAFPAPIPRLR